MKVTDNTLGLSDVSGLSLGDRMEHFRQSYGAYDSPHNSSQRMSLCRLADDEARDEMLQEIHTMLLHLCKNSQGK